MDRAIIKGGKVYRFENTRKDTRRGFSHTTELFLDGVLLTTRKANYINRTWENYAFQPTMRGAICNVLDDLEIEAKAQFLKLHDFKIITEKRRLKLDAGFSKWAKVIELIEVLGEL
jgi:hypothetical protein